VIKHACVETIPWATGYGCTAAGMTTTILLLLLNWIKIVDCDW
jgi:hypothetical protein